MFGISLVQIKSRKPAAFYSGEKASFGEKLKIVLLNREEIQVVGVFIGIQDFVKIITKDMFYIDKSHFIKEWWESDDDVTLITRPRRFGKTLNLNMPPVEIEIWVNSA